MGGGRREDLARKILFRRKVEKVKQEIISTSGGQCDEEQFFEILVNKVNSPLERVRGKGEVRFLGQEITPLLHEASENPMLQEVIIQMATEFIKKQENEEIQKETVRMEIPTITKFADQKTELNQSLQSLLETVNNFQISEEFVGQSLYGDDNHIFYGHVKDAFDAFFKRNEDSENPIINNDKVRAARYGIASVFEGGMKSINSKDKMLVKIKTILTHIIEIVKVKYQLENNNLLPEQLIIGEKLITEFISKIKKDETRFNIIAVESILEYLPTFCNKVLNDVNEDYSYANREYTYTEITSPNAEKLAEIYAKNGIEAPLPPAELTAELTAKSQIPAITQKYDGKIAETSKFFENVKETKRVAENENEKKQEIIDNVSDKIASLINELAGTTVLNNIELKHNLSGYHLHINTNNSYNQYIKSNLEKEVGYLHTELTKLEDEKNNLLPKINTRSVLGVKLTFQTTADVKKNEARLAEIEAEMEGYQKEIKSKESQIKLEDLKLATFNENDKKIREVNNKIRELCEGNNISNNNILSDLYKVIQEKLEKPSI